MLNFAHNKREEKWSKNEGKNSFHAFLTILLRWSFSCDDFKVVKVKKKHLDDRIYSITINRSEFKENKKKCQNVK